jgi:hypothetical protein
MAVHKLISSNLKAVHHFFVYHIENSLSRLATLHTICKHTNLNLESAVTLLRLMCLHMVGLRGNDPRSTG